MRILARLQGLTCLGQQGNGEKADIWTHRQHWDWVDRDLGWRSCGTPKAQTVYYVQLHGEVDYCTQLNKEAGLASLSRSSGH